jgi:hypothetical protein
MREEREKEDDVLGRRSGDGGGEEGERETETETADALWEPF